MTDEVNAAAPLHAHADAHDPTMEERAKTLVADFEHAHKHNAPVTPSMLTELKAVLGHAEPNEDTHPS